MGAKRKRKAYEHFLACVERRLKNDSYVCQGVHFDGQRFVQMGGEHQAVCTDGLPQIGEIVRLWVSRDGITFSAAQSMRLIEWYPGMKHGGSA